MYTIRNVTPTFVKSCIKNLMEAQDIHTFGYYFKHLCKCAELLNPGMLSRDTKYWKILETISGVLYNMEYLYIWACDRKKQLAQERLEEKQDFNQLCDTLSQNFNITDSAKHDQECDFCI